MSDQGTGVAVTWDSNYLGSLNSLGVSVNREEIDVTTFATTGGKEFEPSDLVETTITGSILLAPGVSPNVLGGASSSLAIAFTDSGAASWAWTTAFMVSIDITATLEDRVRADVTIRANGLPTITP